MIGFASELPWTEFDEELIIICLSRGQIKQLPAGFTSNIQVINFQNVETSGVTWLDGMNGGFLVPSLVPNQTSQSLSGEQNSNPSEFKTIYI